MWKGFETSVSIPCGFDSKYRSSEERLSQVGCWEVEKETCSPRSLLSWLPTFCASDYCRTTEEPEETQILLSLFLAASLGFHTWRQHQSHDLWSLRGSALRCHLWLSPGIVQDSFPPLGTREHQCPSPKVACLTGLCLCHQLHEPLGRAAEASANMLFFCKQE